LYDFYDVEEECFVDFVYVFLGVVFGEWLVREICSEDVVFVDVYYVFGGVFGDVVVGVMILVVGIDCGGMFVDFD